ncbi:hypothetical protein IC614_01940 [Allosphingosinicella flava]|uniref:VCBS repeat-containing protein n=1 Tax=Allosphingosinicella flava TaxID=2771430 RepID=A0A7T2GK75_9SPHN|nr:hypothetical protein [Sphingosinicella flava]QPQ55396.1 hypothetical protein IC614_01940 [Sphingosinicella flava]
MSNEKMEANKDGRRIGNRILIGLIAIVVLGVAALFAWPKDGVRPASPSSIAAPEASMVNDMQAADDAQAIAPGTFAEWSAERYPEAVTFKAGELRVTVTAVLDEGMAAPEVRVTAPGMKDHVMKGELAQPTATHRIGVGRLNPQARIDHIILASYSGGAHCCTRIQVAAPLGEGFTTVDLGEWDGAGLNEFPKDISGDGVADFVLYDNAFLYAFAPYAFSDAPPLVYNLVGTKFRDVSKAPAFRPLFAKSMANSRADCITPQDDNPRNGACAAYVASAARAGRLDQAWGEMLTSYGQSEEWDLPPSCKVKAEPCPDDQQFVQPNYPDALSDFLVSTGYIPAGTQLPNVPQEDSETGGE